MIQIFYLKNLKVEIDNIIFSADSVKEACATYDPRAERVAILYELQRLFQALLHLANVSLDKVLER